MNDRIKEFATAIDQTIERFEDIQAYEMVGILHMAAAAVEAAAYDGQVSVVIACAENDLPSIWEGSKSVVQ